jgi:hypothetical protein
MSSKIQLIEILSTKFLWIIDDLRININKISTYYPNYLKEVENQTVEFTNQAYIQKNPNITIKNLNNYSKQDFMNLVKDEPYSALERMYVAEKMDGLNKYPEELIPFMLKYGTKSDFIYRTAYIYIFSILEGFNSNLIELFAKTNPNLIYNERKNILHIIRKNKETKIKIYYNLRSLNKIFKKKIKICNLKKEFEYYLRLSELQEIRNLLVHNLGIVNQRFLDKFKEKDYYLGGFIKINNFLFNELVNDVILYILFMKIKFLNSLVK